MRCPLRFRGSILIASFLFLAAFTSAGCSSEETVEAGAVGTAATGPIGITFSQTYLTLENRAGVPIVDTRVEIITRGLRPPFRTTVPRLETSSKHDIPYNQFRSADGTTFQRGALPTRTLKVTGTEITGKVIELEIPFG